MTESLEFNAATVEEALERAAERTGTPVEELTYDVLDAGSPGFLGIGARDARITVTSIEPDASDRSGQAGSRELDLAATREDGSGSPAGEEQSGSSAPTEAIAEETAQVPDKLIAEIEEFVTHVVEAMGFEARIGVYDAGEFIAVDVNSGETGLFIGQKGETIDALQYLLNVSSYRNRHFTKRIVVDSEGYRQRRIEAVQGIAHRMARKAVRESRLVELPPMNSAERRVVHLFLKDNPSVDTSSEGTGDNRRVTISPTR